MSTIPSGRSTCATLTEEPCYLEPCVLRIHNMTQNFPLEKQGQIVHISEAIDKDREKQSVRQIHIKDKACKKVNKKKI